MRRLFLPIALVALALTGSSASALTKELVDDIYSSPVFVTSDPQEPDRLFVVEQGGRIKVTENGVTRTFLNVSDRIATATEQGLLSMAFAPDYPFSGRFYVVYTAAGDGAIQVDEFTVADGSVEPGTRRPVITIERPAGHTNHNGGQLQFGPDGYLYISTGDGGPGGDGSLNAQNLSTGMGKILRIDPRQSGGAPYSVPDNPFVGQAGAAPEIWSYGLRNPWRFSFDRATGALLIGDVGQNAREEVDFEPQPDAGRGDNFGWSCFEGSQPFTEGNITPDPACEGASASDFTMPIHDYRHVGDNCSVTGGYVVRDPSLGDLVGRYLYADFCVGKIRSLVLPEATDDPPEATDDRFENVTVDNPTSFGEDSCGRLYVASRAGPVYRLVGSTPADCAPPPPDPPVTPAPATDTSPTEPPAPQPEPADLRAPELELVPGRGGIGRDRELACRVRVDEESDVVGRFAVVAGVPSRAGGATARAGRRDKVLIRLAPERAHVEPGTPRKLTWRLQRRQLRALARFRDRGVEPTARFRVRARDAAGNRGPRLEATAPLD